MTKEEIVSQVNKIFKVILENELLVITETTKADDVEEWDSLTHIQLVVAIERHFKIKFTTAEIQGWHSAGDIFESIAKRLQA